jgi:hypothetical protein
MRAAEAEDAPVGFESGWTPRVGAGEMVGEEATDPVEEAADPVEEAVDSVEEAVDSVEEVSDSVEEVSDSVEEAANSVEEAADPVEEVVDSVSVTTSGDSLHSPLWARLTNSATAKQALSYVLPLEQTGSMFIGQATTIHSPS